MKTQFKLFLLQGKSEVQLNFLSLTGLIFYNNSSSKKDPSKRPRLPLMSPTTEVATRVGDRSRVVTRTSLRVRSGRERTVDFKSLKI